jgi:hypothetical protein
VEVEAEAEAVFQGLPAGLPASERPPWVPEKPIPGMGEAPPLPLLSPVPTLLWVQHVLKISTLLSPL